VPAERCLCGSAYASVDEIRGRLDDVFLYEDRRIHPHVFRSALARHDGIVEYQVRQTPSGATIAVRCQAPVDLKQLASELAHALTRAGLANPRVAVTAVERVERDPGTAKLERFVPLHPEAPPK
jgi:phenylacetate-CoA ligase